MAEHWKVLKLQQNVLKSFPSVAAQLVQNSHPANVNDLERQFEKLAVTQINASRSFALSPSEGTFLQLWWISLSNAHKEIALPLHLPWHYLAPYNSVAHKATNKYWNTGIILVALKATGVPKSDPNWKKSLVEAIISNSLISLESKLLPPHVIKHSGFVVIQSNFRRPFVLWIPTYDVWVRKNAFSWGFVSVLEEAIISIPLISGLLQVRSFSLLSDLKLCKSILSFHGSFNSALGNNCCQTATFVATKSFT